MKTLLFSTALALMTAGLAAAPASALTMKECSAKYQDAKKANTLKGQKWNDFRKANCADDDASDNDAAAAVTDAPAPAATPAATTAAKSGQTCRQGQGGGIPEGRLPEILR
jgi:hypothetical protein